MDIQEIRSQLPIGAVKQIAIKSGVNYCTVQRFFSGEKTKENLNLMKVTAEFLKEYKQAESEAIKELQDIASA